MIKEREEAKGLKIRDVLIVIIAIVLVLCGIFGISKEIVNQQEQQLLAETPLKDTVYWSSMDNYPKYKVEAAKMVNELMAEGVDQVTACQTALEMVSDKIYEDTIKFIEENPDAEGDNWETEYMTYVAETQK